MGKPNVNPYKKHNSFVELRHKHSETDAEAHRRLEAVRNRQDLIGRLSEAHQAILTKVYLDLSESKPDDETPRFRLSPNVAEEINSLPPEALPRYLVHRYRYEVYPALYIVDEYPPYLQIEPSSMCNYRCVFCFETDKFFTKRSNGFMGHMRIDTFKQVVDQAEGHVEFLSIASRGEPLLCPEIEPMLAYTLGKFLNLKLNTNASLLDESKCHAILQSGVKTLVFSADAAEEPLYSQLRVGGKLAIVLANVKRFQKIRATQYPDSRIITRVSGVKLNNQQNLDSMQKLWGDLVDQVAFVNYNPWENTYQRPANDITTPCSDLWRRMFVWWDGKVNPCDVDYKSTLSVGSLLNTPLSQLWTGTGYSGLRDMHLTKSRGQPEPCRRCTVI